MPGPLEGLKKATAIGPDAPISTAPLREGLDSGVQGLLGAFGLGDDSSSANRFGAMAGAAIPIGRGLMNPHPAIRALLDTLSSAPEEINPMKLLANDKVGGFQIPHRAQISVPHGFELPDEANPWIARDPQLSEQRVLRLNGTVNSNPPPPQSSARQRIRPGAWKDVGAGFESKFSNPF